MTRKNPSQVSPRQNDEERPVTNSTQISVQERLVLYTTVSLTGAAIMMLELLGTRIIGPFYGVSLFVWSSLISVALIALAMGYYLGGLLADTSHRFKLSYAIATAGLFTAIIPLISDPILTMSDVLGVRWGAFTSALLLFTVPLTFLAMTGPYVIKQATQELEGIGLASGTVYAVSTIGSVIGTLMLGFFLLPAVGSRAIIYSISAALLLLALALVLFENRSQAKLAPLLSTLLICIVGGGATIASAYTANQNTNSRLITRFEEESIYGWVRVVDDIKDNVRWMLSDSSTIGASNLDGKESLLGYQQVVRNALKLVKPNATRTLLIGLGSGHLSTALAKKHVHTDVIEIDPMVIRSAKEYFAYKPTGRVIVGDARYEIRSLTDKYDLIIHDCFTGGTEPAHLLTVEILRDLKQLLQPDGIFVLNFVGFTRSNEKDAADSVYRTLGEIFTHKIAFVSVPGEDFNDFIFLASQEPIPLDLENRNKQQSQWFKRHIHTMAENSFVISDDYNPLEFLQLHKAEKYREVLIKRIGKKLLIR